MSAQTTQPARRLWSRDEYYRMAELGWFEDERTELVGGEIVVLNPQNFPHSYALDKIAELLRRELSADYWVRTQLPLQCGPSSEPEPDVSVVTGTRDDYSDHPTTALLVVEVSDTTLQFDRREKASLYAKAGIAEYWIVNLVDRVLEVHRTPVAEEGEPFGARYHEVQSLAPGTSITLLEKPEHPMAVADLLP